MEEIWKDIKGYEGFYQVSSCGNVRSLNWANTGVTKNMYLKHHNKGYLQVELAFVKRKKMYMVHRLVAEAFVDNPHNYPIVNHKDENPQNNNASNLEWCTHLYNVRYSASRHPKRAKPIKRERLIEQISKDGEIVRIWDNLVSIRHENGWNDWSIEECCKGHRKRAYGYYWRYVS